MLKGVNSKMIKFILKLKTSIKISNFNKILITLV